jgi:hypothetical protein
MKSDRESSNSDGGGGGMLPEILPLLIGPEENRDSPELDEWSDSLGSIEPNRWR